MITGRLNRFETGLQGTLGRLTIEAFSCFIIELPWRDNKKQVSCIPVGDYAVAWHRSPKFGPIYKVLGVPDRDAILTHAGNYAGDTAEGFRSHSYGCLIAGKYYGNLDGQRAVMVSKPTLRLLETYLNRQTWKLEIRHDDHIRAAA